MRSFMVSALVVLLLFCAVSKAHAGGSNVYPLGAEGFWMGAAPPPGVYYMNYTLYYNASRYNDNSGRQYRVGPLADFDIDVWANVSRFIYMSDKQVLGGNWGAHIFLVYQDAFIRTAGGRSRVSGLGDTIIDPFILSWHWPTFHLVTGVDIYVPTGRYDAGRIANLSANTWVIEPVVSMTWMTPAKGVVASVKFMYDFPGENTDWEHPFMPGVTGDLQYGQEFHFDYSVDYMINENWKAGIGGYYYRQTTDDELDGVRIRGQRGRVWSIGPGVEYAKGRWMVSYRSQFEQDAKNRPEGVSNWLRLTYAF